MQGRAQCRPHSPPVCRLLIKFFLASRERILHQRADGHWANAARNGRDEGALGRNLVELNVSAQSETALARGVFHTRGAYVNNNGALFHHVGRNKVGASDGRYDDIGLAALVFERRRVRVAHRNSGIAVLLLHHQLRHWLTNDVAATKHNALLTRSGDAVTLQKGEDTQRRGRDETRQTDGHAPHIDGMKTVYVFAAIAR